MQVLVYDQNGAQIAEIEPDVTSVVWRLNGVGQAKMSIGYGDVTPDILTYGNRVLIRFDNGLPNFGGVFDPPMRHAAWTISPTAYSGEHILGWRVTAKARYFTGAVPGFIYATLIRDANATRPTGINIGDISTAGQARTIACHHHDLLNKIKDLQKLCGHDFAITPVLNGNVLSFNANWYERRGTDKSGAVRITDGANLVDAVMDSQGTIAGRVLLAGAGQTWGGDRYIAVETDETSIADYDYREWFQIQSGVVVNATLDYNAEETLSVMKQPRLAFRLKVADCSPGRFADYDLGDIVQLTAFTRHTGWTFDGKVRIEGRRWSDSGICDLEVTEWTS